MTSQIKITQLSDIGNGLANTTLVPVVNMAGVPSTQKATVGNIANSILAGAGTTYQNAGVANIAFSVANAAQPNITSVGTLSVNTLKITGGTAGQVLSTDGAGNLSFTTVSGGGSNGLPLANGTSNFDIATADGNVTVTADGETWTFGTNGVLALPNETNIYGNGQFQIDTVGGFQLTSFTDNVGSGAQTWLFDSNGDLTLPDGTILLGDGSGIEYPTSPGYEWDLHSSDGNVYIGSVEDMAYIDTYSPNIGVRLRSNENDWIFGPDGNLTLPGNTFAVNYANGTQVPLGGGGNANTGNVTFDNINIIGTGNLNLQPDPADAAAYVNIYLTGDADIHMAAGAAGANLILGTDEEANVAVLQGGNVAIQAGNVSGTQTWTFDTSGNLTLPNTANVSINYADGNSYLGKFKIYNGDMALLYTDGLYDIIMSPGGEDYSYIFIPNANNAALGNPLRIGAMEPNSAVQIETEGGNWTFNNNGTTIFPTLEVDLHNGGVQTGQVLQFGNPNLQAIITGPTPSANVSAQRLIIQGQRGNGTGKGGDVYVWGGDADTNGGDIKIYAGDADNVSIGSGGYVNIDGGAGFDNGGGITLTGGISANGYGGQVSMTGGSGELEGGSASLQGGYGANGQGGAVQIAGGGGNSQATYGNVEIGSGTYAWLFDNTGNVRLPGNTFAVNYANGTQVSIGGGNTGNVTFNNQVVVGTGDGSSGSGGLYLAPGLDSTANLQYLRVRGGDVATHIHLDTGNNSYFDQYFGSDIKYVKLANTGNVVIGSNDAVGNSASWTFGVDGNLTLPGGDIITDSIQTVIISGAGTAAVNQTYELIAETGQYVGQTDSDYQIDTPEAPSTTYKLRISTGDPEGFYESEDLITWTIVAGAGGGAAPAPTGVIVPRHIALTVDTNSWVFDIDGYLTLPADATISDFSETASLNVDGSGRVAQLYWNGNIGNGNPDIGSDYYTWAYVASGGFFIQHENVATSTDNLWGFGIDGNLTLPGNLVITGNANVFGTDSALIQPTDDKPLIALSSGANGAVSSLWVEDIGNVGTSNIAAVYANPTVGSKIVRIAVGQNGGNAGPNLWDFGTTGNLTLPTNGHIIVGGGIVGGGASPAPYISGFDSIGALEFTNGNSNVTVNSNSNLWTFDSTGNLTLPANAFAINYANGTQVSLGGGNVTWAQIDDKAGNSGPTIIALGQNAGFDGQGNAAIAIGKNAGAGGQGASSITIGEDAGGNTTQGADAVAIGRSAGYDAQGLQAVAIGLYAGTNTQGQYSVAIGGSAGATSQGQESVAVGVNSGSTAQGIGAVSIGASSGASSQGNTSVAIGTSSGALSQGANAVAIGYLAGYQSQGNNSIILNATGANLNQTTANTFTVSPVRNDTSNIAEVMFYNATSKEVTYGNTLSVAGNISANNFTGNGGGLSNVATKISSSWTIASGNNTVSISVPGSGTYSIWVNGNIPNGIITYTATAVVTNPNVPVLGEQYGWFYEIGNALVLTSIPNQFVGTQGAISNAAPYSGNTANVFTFGITNNSGANAVVNWGYTKL
jgi:hypothetical protein